LGTAKYALPHVLLEDSILFGEKAEINWPSYFFIVAVAFDSNSRNETRSPIYSSATIWIICLSLCIYDNV